MEGETMNNLPRLGDLLICKRFQNARMRNDGLLEVGHGLVGDCHHDAARAKDKFLVVHIRASDNRTNHVTGGPTSSSYEVVALRLCDGKLGEAIVFECKGVCSNKI